VNIIKRRAAGGRKLHFLEGREGMHAQTALCDKRARWRYPGEERDNMRPDPDDCPRCVDRFCKAGGQFS
jgi:hypothetical protein